MRPVTNEEFSLLYHKFKTSGQTAVCLDIALFCCLEDRSSSRPETEEYRACLRRRKIPAQKLLKQEQNTGLLLPEERSDWLRLRLPFIRQYPSLAPAFSGLKPCKKENVPWGTDGVSLFYSRMPSPTAFLHMVLHCLFLHVLPPKREDARCWDLACDLCVFHLIRSYFPQFLKPSLTDRIEQYLDRPEARVKRENRAKREQILNMLYREISPFHAGSICRRLSRNPETIPRWESLFREDSHQYWRDPKQDCRSKLSLAKTWKGLQNRASLQAGYEGKHRGKISGSSSASFSLRLKPDYDYRRFLSRFSQPGEEICLDFENFDYIPYAFSRAYYKNLVFLEPLEYCECRKLKELVIAIDTSGSCRGEIVKRFLEETGHILNSRENFFRKMKVHLIQCDSMIQGYTCITDLKQWNRQISSLKVQGFGGTDFRPVFGLVKDLQAQKKIRDLKGLIYFTDGDGIYPSSAPDYETAFVFLNRGLQKGKVPSWAYKLNLNLPLSQEETKQKERSLL